MQIHAHVHLARRDGIDTYAGPLQDRHAGADDTQRRVGRHGVAGAPAPAVGRRHAADDDDAAVALRLGRGVGVGLLLGQLLGHGGRGVLEGEEGRHRVRLEAALQIVRGGVVDRGRAEQARRAHPDIEAAEGVEDLVDEGDGVFFFGNVEGVGDELGLRVVFGDGGGEGLVGVCVWAGGSVTCWRGREVRKFS